MHRAGSALLSLLAVAGLTAATGSAAGAAIDDDADRSPAQTALTWGPCEEDVDPAFECATLNVPLDYANPSGEQIGLALIRLPASPANRQGAVLFNPGGPGGSGYDYVANIGFAAQASMTGFDRFDLVGFDPRGVDRSNGLRCIDDPAVDATLYLDDTPDDQADEVALFTSELAFIAGCRVRYGDTLKFYSTENTARDMDEIRKALGDPQISFVGVSYGTYLGGVYATLFPDQVRAMVLDSAYEPTGDTEAQQYITQLVGFEDAFGNWAAWCEESSDCAFTAVDVGARWDALLTQLDVAPIKSDSGREVNQAVMERATTATLYSRDVWPLLASALVDAEQGDGTALLGIADNYNGRHDDGTFDTIFQSFPVIQCASGIAQRAPSDPTALLAEMQAAAPRFSRDVRIGDLRDRCRDLFLSGVTPIVPSYSGAAPIVVIGGTDDPATPFRWAEELNAMLGPSSRLVTFEGEGHGQILNNTCVTDIEAAVIASLQLPAAGTVCQPDPPVAQPTFWSQLPVPAGVGPPLDDPLIPAMLGLPETQYYSDAWLLTGDANAVVQEYQTALTGLGFTIFGVRDDIFPGVSVIQSAAPDATTGLVVLVIPTTAMASNEDLADLAELVPAGGTGLVVAAAFALQ